MNNSLAGASLAVGHGLLALSGRSWRWGAETFLRSPLGSTGLVVAMGLTLMAGTNALYFQDGHHPAPMFGMAADTTPRQPETIAPVVVEPEAIPQRPASETAANATPSVAPPVQTASSTPASSPPTSIGNPDIASMQAKLMELGFFDGTVDGYYGPKTADAIRAFEARAGLPRTGAATPQVIQAVRDAPLNTSATQPASQPPPAAQDAPVQVASVDADDVAPLLAQMQQEGGQSQVVADVTPAEEPAAPPAQTASAPVPAALDGDLVSDVQRGLARLGFLQGAVTGVADEATARAIRRFQIFYNYAPTGEVSTNLRQMLVNAGAYL